MGRRGRCLCERPRATRELVHAAKMLKFGNFRACGRRQVRTPASVEIARTGAARPALRPIAAHPLPGRRIRTLHRVGPRRRAHPDDRAPGIAPAAHRTNRIPARPHRVPAGGPQQTCGRRPECRDTIRAVFAAAKVSRGVRCCKRRTRGPYPPFWAASRNAVPRPRTSAKFSGRAVTGHRAAGRDRGGRQVAWAGSGSSAEAHGVPIFLSQGLRRGIGQPCCPTLKRLILMAKIL